MENKHLMHVPSVTFAHQREGDKVRRDLKLKYGVKLTCLRDPTERAVRCPRFQARDRKNEKKIPASRLFGRLPASSKSRWTKWAFRKLRRTRAPKSSSSV